MSAAKHSPGPWKVCEPTKTMHAIRSANGRTIADVGYSGSFDGDEANARLIAAAPELLATLNTAKWMLERDYIDDQKMTVIRKCEDAIAKATEVQS